MGSAAHTSRADTETIIKDAEGYEDVATTEKIICVSIVSVKVATSTAQCTGPVMISCIILLLGNVNSYQRRALGQSTPRPRHPVPVGFG